MELDMTEYDQVDELKLFLDTQKQLYGENSSAKFLVTLSSCSDQDSFDDANCENDFVFLPSPTLPSKQQHPTSPGTRQPARSQGDSSPSSTLETNSARTPAPRCSDYASDSSAQNDGQLGIKNNTDRTSLGHNPFCNLSLDPKSTRPFESYAQRPLAARQPLMQRLEACLSKPVGLLELGSSVSSNPNKLTELMKQIVTRSDLIYIAIPCAYCHEAVTCPPSDISSWLNHMNRHHNCKVCPVCNRMVGLGADRDLDIMRQHVLTHLDDEWLDQRNPRVSFTQGLQQQWFSGSRCSIKDPRYK